MDSAQPIFAGLDVAALAYAMVVVFALAAVAYMARCLIVTAESSAEGYDVAPPLPNPMVVEELFGAFLGLISLSFFASDISPARTAVAAFDALWELESDLTGGACESAWPEGWSGP